MPPRKLTTPFKAPRQVTKKGTTSPGVGHRKDNAEWGKRMERELGQIEKRKNSVETKQDSDDDDEPIVHQIPSYLKTLSEKEADEMAKFGEVQRYSSDSEGDEVPISETLAEASKESAVDIAETNNKHAEMIGKRVGKDFGSLGVFLGTVMNVEYDSDDATHKVPYYVVEYTDGDREDLNESEMEYAMELAFQIELDEEDELELAKEKDKELGVTSSEDEESYRPPKVYFIDVLHLVYSKIKSFLQLHLLETAKKE
jgi:hypothetical protein